MSDAPTVFVVDDDPAARDSVCALISSKGLQAEAYDSAASFLAKYEPSRPGCLVLDYSMPDMNGLELQQTLARQGSKLPVIIITAYANVPLTLQAWDGGAFTLLEKNYVNRELWEKIQRAIERNTKELAQAKLCADIQRRMATLTPDEARVMSLLVDGHSNKQVAAALGIGLRTAELRRACVMDKMQANSLPELVKLVLIVRGTFPENGCE